MSDTAIVPKGGCQYPLIEDNVDRPTAPALAIAFGGDTDKYGHGTGAVYQTYNVVARNNIFANCTGGALGTYDCYHGYFYNNLVLQHAAPI